MKRSTGERNQSQNPYKPFFKRNHPFKAIEPPPTNLNIDLGNVASDSFCTYHQENHSEREFPQWVHTMNLMANHFLDEVSLTEQSSSSATNIVDQEEADPPRDTAMLIWDPNVIVPSDDLFEPIQVKNTIHCNLPHLKNYQQEVHRLIECFEAFNITAIPRANNILVDSLATGASRLLPLEDYEASRFTVEILYKPSVPNNVSNWKFFEGDEQIIRFLTNQDNFKDLTIDDEEFQENSIETDPRAEQHMDKSKAHTIPKGIANLENLFDLKERFKGPKNAKTSKSCPLHETVNLGTPENPKHMNLGKTISKEERKAYLKLFRQY
jgi:hypothetical protein